MARESTAGGDALLAGELSIALGTYPAVGAALAVGVVVAVAAEGALAVLAPTRTTWPYALNVGL